MHAVACHGPVLGLMHLLLAPLGSTWAVTAVVGHPAPELSLPSLHADGESVNLADYRGKVVYLDFWSSWCAPCRRSMPRLDALRQAFPREDFEVVGVNVDPVVADARRFLERVPVSYPVVVDRAGGVAGRFGVSALPALAVIDRDGVVREIVIGKAVEAHRALRARLVQLVEEGGVQ